MKRLIVMMGGDTVNIEADWIKRDNDQIYAMNRQNEIIGVFQIGLFDALYLSGKKENDI